MDVPESDLGEMSQRGRRVAGGREWGVGVGMGDGEGRVKATVMMKHFQFNESGGNQEEMGFCAFAVYCSLLKAPGGLAVAEPWRRRMQTPPAYKPLVVIPRGKATAAPLWWSQTSNQIKARSLSPPPPGVPLKSPSDQTASFSRSS